MIVSYSSHTAVCISSFSSFPSLGNSNHLQVWLCGGSMEVLPCSRVAHIARMKKPYHSNIAYHTRRNALRVAEVWMDEYKSHVYLAWNIPMEVRGFLEKMSALFCKSNLAVIYCSNGAVGRIMKSNLSFFYSTCINRVILVPLINRRSCAKMV